MSAMGSREQAKDKAVTGIQTTQMLLARWQQSVHRPKGDASVEPTEGGEHGSGHHLPQHTMNDQRIEGPFGGASAAGFCGLCRRVGLTNARDAHMRRVAHATSEHAWCVWMAQAMFVCGSMGKELYEMHRECTHKVWREYSREPRWVIWTVKRRQVDDDSYYIALQEEITGARNGPRSFPLTRPLVLNTSSFPGGAFLLRFTIVIRITASPSPAAAGLPPSPQVPILCVTL